MLFHLPHLIDNCPFNIQRKRNGGKFSPCLAVILHKKFVKCIVQYQSLDFNFQLGILLYITRDRVSYYYIDSTRALWINLNF